MSYDNGNKTKRTPTLLSMPKLRLSAMNPTNKRWATLSYAIWQNNPRIVVDCADDSLRNKEMHFGKIEAPLDPLLFGVYLELLQEVVDGPADRRIKATTLEKGRDGNNEPVARAEIWVGKDKEGVVAITVVPKQEGFPTIKFPFGPSDQRWFKLHHQDGTEFTKAEMSVRVARAYVRLLTQVMNHVLVKDYTPPEPPPGGWGNKGGGNRGGGGGYNRGGGGNYSGGGQQRQQSQQQAADDIDDNDAPF